VQDSLASVMRLVLRDMSLFGRALALAQPKLADCLLFQQAQQPMHMIGWGDMVGQKRDCSILQARKDSRRSLATTIIQGSLHPLSWALKCLSPYSKVICLLPALAQPCIVPLWPRSVLPVCTALCRPLGQQLHRALQLPSILWFACM
jgi:hypothetical protein